MDHPKDIESTLDALLLNAKELQDSSDDALSDIELAETQRKLLDHLFHQWNLLNGVEKQELFSQNIEAKVFEFSQKNHACLKHVRPKTYHKNSRLKTEQLNLFY